MPRWLRVRSDEDMYCTNDTHISFSFCKRYKSNIAVSVITTVTTIDRYIPADPLGSDSKTSTVGCRTLFDGRTVAVVEVACSLCVGVADGSTTMEL